MLTRLFAVSSQTYLDAMWILRSFELPLDGPKIFLCGMQRWNWHYVRNWNLSSTLSMVLLDGHIGWLGHDRLSMRSWWNHDRCWTVVVCSGCLMPWGIEPAFFIRKEWRILSMMQLFWDEVLWSVSCSVIDLNGSTGKFNGNRLYDQQKHSPVSSKLTLFE